MSRQGFQNVWASSPASGSTLLAHLALADIANESGVRPPISAWPKWRGRPNDRKPGEDPRHRGDDGQVKFSGRHLCLAPRYPATCGV